MLCLSVSSLFLAALQLDIFVVLASLALAVGQLCVAFLKLRCSWTCLFNLAEWQFNVRAALQLLNVQRNLIISETRVLCCCVLVNIKIYASLYYTSAHHCPLERQVQQPKPWLPPVLLGLRLVVSRRTLRHIALMATSAARRAGLAGSIAWRRQSRR
jgi:hypothetical protein